MPPGMHVSAVSDETFEQMAAREARRAGDEGKASHRHGQVRLPYCAW